jgi:ATP-binding cassette subfamily B (MDR/TAP) protein 1
MYQRGYGSLTQPFFYQRFNIVRSADVIIVMAAGKIVEQGSHSELMARRGHYYGMHQSALGDNGM